MMQLFHLIFSFFFFFFVPLSVLQFHYICTGATVACVHLGACVRRQCASKSNSVLRYTPTTGWPTYRAYPQGIPCFVAAVCIPRCFFGDFRDYSSHSYLPFVSFTKYSYNFYFIYLLIAGLFEKDRQYFSLLLAFRVAEAAKNGYFCFD